MSRYGWSVALSDYLAPISWIRGYRSLALHRLQVTGPAGSEATGH